MTDRLKKTCLMIALFGFMVKSAGSEERVLFPIPEGMTMRIQFWVNVFTLYSNHQMIIHDADKPERIYKVVDVKAYFADGRSDKDGAREILEREKDKVVSILKKLSTIDPADSLSREELRIYRLFGADPTKNAFIRAAQSVRIQDGMRETFLDGLVRSGKYLAEVKAICRRYGLPEALAYLPHIESSYFPHAHSRYGAVGMWQFTKTTGGEYLVIRNEIDERRDPYLSTEAAAKHLKMLYRQLESWPLAITAYNHGLSGIRRAVQRVGTTDLGRIVREYRNRNFGFASKNFYAEFLAAVWVSENTSQYFGQVHYESPLRVSSHVLQDDQKLSAIVEKFDISVDALKDLNPALRPPIFREEKPVPNGYRLMLPADDVVTVFHDSVIAEDRHTLQIVDAENQEEGKWTRLFMHVKSWMKTLFSFNPDQTQPNEGSRTVLVPREEGENVIGPDRDRSNHPDEDLLGLMVPEDGGETVSKLPLTDLEITSSLAVNDQSVTVYPDETLGHYADWLEIPTWTLRRLNQLSYYQPIRVGQKIDLNFDKVSVEAFKEKRIAYHRGIREQFFEEYRVDRSIAHTVGRGETLWTLAVNRYNVPLWLLMVYNYDKNFDRVRPGETMTIPVIEKVHFSPNGTT